MNAEEVRRTLVEFGAERFMVDGSDKTIFMEERDYSRVRHANLEEWPEFEVKFLRLGWKIEQRDYIPLLI